MGVVASVTSTFSFVLVSGGHVGEKLCSTRLAQILTKVYRNGIRMVDSLSIRSSSSRVDG